MNDVILQAIMGTLPSCGLSLWQAASCSVVAGVTRLSDGQQMGNSEKLLADDGAERQMHAGRNSTILIWRNGQEVNPQYMNYIA